MEAGGGGGGGGGERTAGAICTVVRRGRADDAAVGCLPELWLSSIVTASLA